MKKHHKLHIYLYYEKEGTKNHKFKVILKLMILKKNYQKIISIKN